MDKPLHFQVLSNENDGEPEGNNFDVVAKIVSAHTNESSDGNIME